MPFSQERTDLIIERLRQQLESGSPNEWERSFFSNMLERFERDGNRVSLSKAQYRKLHQLLGISEKRRSPAEASFRSNVVKQAPLSQTSVPKPSGRRRNARPKMRSVSPIDAVYAPQRTVRRVTRQLRWPLVLVFCFLGFIAAVFDTGEEYASQGGQETVRSNAPSLVVTGNSVNQRSGPSTADPIMGQLKAGTQVVQLDLRSGWIQISSELGTGWMSSRYLRPEGSVVAGTNVTNRRTLRASDVRVIDGDTIGILGQRANVRLVGFNAPEIGSPQCNAELVAGRQATARLQGLINEAQTLEYERLACACRPGTEGTRRCNYGRQCGVLKVNGVDVGRILISERLAVPYICGRTSCPPRPGSWCR